MSTGDDPKPRSTSVPTTSGGRRRGAVKPPVIDLEARELDAEPQQAGPAETAAEPTAAEPTAAEPTAAGPAATAPSAEPEFVAETGTPPLPEEPDAASTQTEAVAAPSMMEEEPSTTATAGDGPPQGPPEEPPYGGEPPGGDSGGEEPPREPLPTARRASVIAAGLIGALVSLAIYLGLYYGGILPRDLSTAIDGLIVQNHELNRRVASLEADAARTPRRDVTRELSNQLKELESAFKELGADPKNTLVRRVRNLEQKLEDLAAKAEAVPSDLGARLQSVEDWVALLDSEGAENGPSAPNPMVDRLASLEAEMAALKAGTAGRPGEAPADDPAAQDSAPPEAPAVQGETSVEAPAPAARPARDEQVGQLRERMAALEQRLTEMAGSLDKIRSEAGQAAADQVAGLESGLAALKGDVESLRGALASADREIDTKLAAVEKTIDQRTASESRAAAAALSVAALQRAVDSGRPYRDDLQVLKRVAPKDIDIPVLEARAATGVPTPAALRNAFSTLAGDILRSGGGSDDGRLVGRLLSGAQTLVRIRPTGKAEGDSLGAIVARIEAALAGGDLAEAERQWNTLDEAAKTVSSAWAADLVARVGAEQELAQLSAKLGAAVAGN